MTLSLFTKVASSLGVFLSKWPLVLRSLPLPHALLNRCTWKSSQYYIITIMMKSLMHMSYTPVFHERKCISAMRRIVSTVAMHIRLNFFMYLFVPCYCDACLKPSALRVGVKTLHNTLYQGSPTRGWRSTVRAPILSWIDT